MDAPSDGRGKTCEVCCFGWIMGSDVEVPPNESVEWKTSLAHAIGGTRGAKKCETWA